MNKLWILVLLGLLAIPCTVAADSYSIFPGQEQNITCDYEGENHSVACTSQHVCSINRTVIPGEIYSFHEGPCEVDFVCSEYNETVPEGFVTFPMLMRLTNSENSTTTNMTILNHVGGVEQTKEWVTSYGDTGYQEWKFDFKCPANINTDINVETCAKYFDQILQTGDPLLFQLASGQTTCLQTLVECQSEVKAVSAQYSDYKVIYQERVDETVDAKADLLACQSSLAVEKDPHNTNSTANQYMAEVNRKVEPYWVWIAVLFGIIIVLVAVGEFYARMW